MTTKEQQQSSSKTLTIVLVVIGIIAVIAFIGLLSAILMRSTTNELNKEAERLQETANDTVRKSDLAKISSSIYEYQMNNNGRLPSDSTTLKRYLTVTSDPDGESYSFAFSSLKDGETKEVKTFDHTVHVVTHAECDGDNGVYAKNARDFALLYRLENKTTFCYSE